MLRDPGHFLALGAGTGLAPVAPGTCGSLVGVALYLPLSHLPLAGYLGVVLLMFYIGVPLCNRTAIALKDPDPGAVVWDEVVGYLLAVSFCSSGVSGIIAGFVAFRFFDILKPWPARLVERAVGGGLGIMLDDAVAAGYAITALEVFEYLSSSYNILQ